MTEDLRANEWKYYNHAMVPKCKPYQTPDTSLFNTKELWKKPLWEDAYFAKYTTEFDCKEESPWYWVICDVPFEICSLKSKYRNEMKKALDNFDVKIINPTDYTDELYDVRLDALASYPKAYRSSISRDAFYKSVLAFKEPTFAAFCKHDGKLAGYINMVEVEDVFLYSGQNVKKEYERFYVNYVLIIGMLDYYKNKIKNGAIIVDGERNIQHITKHQELLIKKFGFRKAFCRLNIVYRPSVKRCVKVLYPFRRVLLKFDRIGLIHKINGVLLLEQVLREQK